MLPKLVASVILIAMLSVLSVGLLRPNILKEFIDLSIAIPALATIAAALIVYLSTPLALRTIHSYGEGGVNQTTLPALIRVRDRVRALAVRLHLAHAELNSRLDAMSKDVENAAKEFESENFHDVLVEARTTFSEIVSETSGLPRLAARHLIRCHDILDEISNELSDKLFQDAIFKRANSDNIQWIALMNKEHHERVLNFTSRALKECKKTARHLERHIPGGRAPGRHWPFRGPFEEQRYVLLHRIDQDAKDS